MGLIDKLKALIEECDEEGGDDGDAVGDAADAGAGLEPEEKEADEAEGGEDAACDEAAAPVTSARKATRRAAKGGEREPESEACGDVEESQEETDDQDRLQEKVKRLEAQVKELQSAKPRGTTGLKPEGAANTADADVKRWREIAGLED
ncbi:hypothetical protein [Xiamenia xianingshaonis]|uniref:Uncharacterized protein n=1 Tax=Xiamenia xianingshaonis TaxID=2682776 RepID=A0A9E6SV54_9ACTN|nr:hypothetical protein [Xiamenia xianingshaonis]NHM14449.1 hypothetical protein [Xiamenia xianingshaonis]QTU84922.1 hypothetical protein J7S26_03155 [Xiamenia xianingshaonis]